MQSAPTPNPPNPEFPGIATVSPLAAALSCACPRCGQGRLYSGMLTVAGTCTVCGLALHRHDSGDGPAVFVILVLGGIVVGLALWLEARLAPPVWLHAVLWPPIILGGAIAMLRLLKALLIALQFRHRAHDYEDGADQGPHHV
ncbi:MAG: DUF983 domain-containing protein [Alphaproteobacteria bacterium]|nr:DUF983 domain-containing protein [Alphaproteobacteria bacterium]